MKRLGIDIGTSTVKTVLLNDENVISREIRAHHGNPVAVLREMLQALPQHEELKIAITGMNAALFRESAFRDALIGEIPAMTCAVKRTFPAAGCIVDIGGQGSRFVTNLDQRVPRFAVNEHCAGGTGSFFEDQMTRLGLKITDYSSLAERAKGIPRLSGRCSVFAKTDIIHRQQEGVSTPDILLGLCYAMVRNYKVTIMRDLPVKKPVVFLGGVTQNIGVYRALLDVLELEEGELIIPDAALTLTAYGAAIQGEQTGTVQQMLEALDGIARRVSSGMVLEPLATHRTSFRAPAKASGVLPADGCALGIDIGSTSTNLVLIDRSGNLVDAQYLRTKGDPEQAVRDGLGAIYETYGEISFLSVGVTGSGRERIGKLIGADAVRDEITAQARAAVFADPGVDTVFEIGGQDSKYISIRDGQVADFRMNKICAAGTGSFVEEQALRMNIPIETFGEMAVNAKAPVALGERCTVFIETAIESAVANGVATEDIAAGICHSIVKNYLTKVVGNKAVGEHILLQGGVQYNPGIVAAFESAFGSGVKVSPYFHVSGAIGAALLALEAQEGESTFHGFTEVPQQELSEEDREIEKNLRAYRSVKEHFLADYDTKRDPKKITVGIPYALMIHKFFPLANAFFRALGYNVLLSDATNEEIIRQSQENARGETCYPVKLIYGHMKQLMEKDVDYIFMPHIHTIKHAVSKEAHNYGCVYMQSAAKSIADILGVEEKGIRLLNPTFDLDMGKEAMAKAMVQVGLSLGHGRPRCMEAMLKGGMAVKKQEAFAEKAGAQLLKEIKPDEKVIVLITRNYGISDPVLNMGIPEILIRRGYKVITLEHLPGHDLDISADHEGLYWPFGQHILSGAKIIAHHPNLYAVYLTNHGCGPDTMLSYLFAREMGEKPYLQIEVDEHFSGVGVITRIEAFLNSLASEKSSRTFDGFDLAGVRTFDVNLTKTIPEHDNMLLPRMGEYTPFITQYLEKSYGLKVSMLPAFDRAAIARGKAETSSKEYLPFFALTGCVLNALEDGKEDTGVMIPSTRGAEADGQYAAAMRVILDANGQQAHPMIAPVLETLPLTLKDPELFFRALLTGDLCYAMSTQDRQELRPDRILSMEELKDLAGKIAGRKSKDRKTIGATGTPLLLTELNEGMLRSLEEKTYAVTYAPLSEALYFLWEEEAEVKAAGGVFLQDAKKMMAELSVILGADSPYDATEELTVIADEHLHAMNGGFGRYRFAKTVALGRRSDAVIHLSPRYENTEMILEMRNVDKACPAPVLQMMPDGDEDEAARERLETFLYYL